jgi:hypothetical protein
VDNDSATRIFRDLGKFSNFALYLAVAAVTTTHRQRLLARPVKMDDATRMTQIQFGKTI